MSLEPPTTEKVVLTTTKGPITLCLWTKEVPVTTDRVMKAICRGLVFQPIVPGELIQLSLPIDEELKLEVHSRLKFNQRGIVGFNHTTNELFFTVKPMPEFNRRFTVVGKCGDNTIFTVIKINESELAPDTNGIALYPTKVDDVILPDGYRSATTEKKTMPIKTKEPERKKRRKIALDLFEEDDEVVDPSQFRLKSAHDTLQDKTLSKEKVQIEDRRLEVKQNPIQKQDHLADAPMSDRQSQNLALEETIKQVEELKGNLKNSRPSKPDAGPTHSSSKKIKELKTLALLERFKQKLSDGSLPSKLSSHRLNFKDNPDNATSWDDAEVVVIESHSSSNDSKHSNHTADANATSK